MKKIFLVASLAFGAVAVGGSLYSRMDADAGEPTLTYYGDGQPKVSICYVDGVKEGPSIEWHPGGIKQAEGSYHEGYRDGAWSFWHEDGSLDSERTGRYEQGRKVAEL
jgi:antitoxin component YwqK of YwqJK toxin-antitoxin module